MIISRTPFRISLFGGGSDYPKWYRQHGGAVLGFAINKYCYLSIRQLPPFFEHKHRVVYSKVETVADASEIQHPAVRNIMQHMGIEHGLEIHHDADLPARSGLGSSSSFVVGLMNALHAYQGRMTTKTQLAAEAINMEQSIIAEHVGSQDQVWAAHGGMNRIRFNRDGSIDVDPLILPVARRKDLLSHFMLFFTGISRFASEVAEKKIAALDAHERQIHCMTAMVDEAQTILSNDAIPVTEIGRMLRETWALKRELADTVTNPEVDGIYDAAMAAGALGGKLLGAGGGGFMLLFVEPHLQQSVRNRLSRLKEVQFDIDTSGSKIVVYEPNGLERC